MRSRLRNTGLVGSGGRATERSIGPASYPKWVAGMARLNDPAESGHDAAVCCLPETYNTSSPAALKFTTSLRKPRHIAMLAFLPTNECSKVLVLPAMLRDSSPTPR